MNKARLIAEICAEHNVRLDPDDPAFILVALNEKVLKDRLAHQPKVRNESEPLGIWVAAISAFFFMASILACVIAYNKGVRTGAAEANMKAATMNCISERDVKEKTNKGKMASDFDRNTRQHSHTPDKE